MTKLEDRYKEMGGILMRKEQQTMPFIISLDEDDGFSSESDDEFELASDLDSVYSEYASDDDDHRCARGGSSGGPCYMLLTPLGLVRPKFFAISHSFRFFPKFFCYKSFFNFFSNFFSKFFRNF